MQADTLLNALLVHGPTTSAPSKAPSKPAESSGFITLLHTMSANNDAPEALLHSEGEAQNPEEEPLAGVKIPSVITTKEPEQTPEEEDETDTEVPISASAEITWAVAVMQPVPKADTELGPELESTAMPVERRHPPGMVSKIFPEQMNLRQPGETMAAPFSAAKTNDVPQTGKQGTEAFLQQYLNPLQESDEVDIGFEPPTRVTSDAFTVPKQEVQPHLGAARIKLEKRPTSLLRNSFTSMSAMEVSIADGQELETKASRSIVSGPDEQITTADFFWKGDAAVEIPVEQLVGQPEVPSENGNQEVQVIDEEAVTLEVELEDVETEPQPQTEFRFTENVNEERHSRPTKQVQAAAVTVEQTEWPVEFELKPHTEPSLSEKRQEFMVKIVKPAASEESSQQSVSIERKPESTKNKPPEQAEAVAGETLQRLNDTSLEVSNSSAERPLELYEAAEAIPELAERMQAVMTTERSEVRIQLKPEHLGELKIRVAVEQGVVSAEFVAESQAVKSLIEANLPELRSALQDMGSTVSELAVYVGGHEQPSEQRHHQGKPQWQPPRRVNRSRVEETAVASTYSRERLTQIDLRV